MSPINQLLIALRFYATGCMLISVGDFGGIHKSTACRIIQRVTRAIASLGPEFINFPRTPEEMMHSQQGFYNIARFPRVIGCIDCRHIKIQSPGGDNAEYFRNRKGYFSINVQAICDANLRIIDVVSRWPGSTHDSQIFRNSAIYARFETEQMNDGLLLGDSGYPVKKYLITPLLNPRNQVEQLFNESQIRTRNVVERCFGVWKRRFPNLSLGMRVKLTTVQDIIVATAVLQNICRLQLEREPPVDPEFNIPEEVHEANMANNGDRDNDDSVRNSLINDYFARYVKYVYKLLHINVSY